MRSYPLAVKLGTITPTSAEVYSYAEDDSVTDPLLTAHLSHWGIDRASMTKTEPTLDDMATQFNVASDGLVYTIHVGAQVEPVATEASAASADKEEVRREDDEDDDV